LIRKFEAIIRENRWLRHNFRIKTLRLRDKISIDQFFPESLTPQSIVLRKPLKILDFDGRVAISTAQTPDNILKYLRKK
jgi:hypothetical protein